MTTNPHERHHDKVFKAGDAWRNCHGPERKELRNEAHILLHSHLATYHHDSMVSLADSLEALQRLHEGYHDDDYE